MLNLQKIQSFENSLEYKLPRVKTKDIIKLNFGLAYFIVLIFSVIKLFFT